MYLWLIKAPAYFFARYYKSTDFEVLGTVIKSISIFIRKLSLVMRLKNKQMGTKNVTRILQECELH